MILNLGCGLRLRDDAINIDIRPIPGAEQKDLLVFPWHWEDCSIDGIYMFHFLEHTPEPVKVLYECYRVLKQGGFLHITVPHSSSVTGIGCLGHYRTFSYNTLKDFLSEKHYIFKDILFRTEYQRIIWQPHHTRNPIQWLIDLSPRWFERIWGYWVGGAVEVVWRGVKL